MSTNVDSVRCGSPADDERTSFALTEKAKEFLAYEPKPEFEEAAAGAAESAE